MDNPSNIPPELKRAVIDEMAALRPELWRKCYPRMYESVRGQYASVKELASTLMGCAVKIEQGFHGENEKSEIVWASKLASYRVPIWWLTRDMAEALQQTTPPQTINLEEIKLPFEAAIFMLPKGTLVHESEEGEATFVSYVRTHLGEEIRSLASGMPEVWRPLGHGTMTVFAGTSAEHLLHWTIPNDHRVNLGQLDWWIQTFSNSDYRHHSEAPHFLNENLTPEDNRFMARAMHLLFGTLILMTSRPDLVTTGGLRKKVQKKHDPVAREFWNPSIIGEHYKIRHEYAPQGGTHASPRGHWVRGFYREQPVGPRLEHQHKQIWIEPFWRGGE